MSHSRPEAVPPPPSAFRILVVDDEPEALWATARILRDAHYEVLTGTSAAEALELTRRHRPAVLLLDVELGDGNGLDVARQLKQDSELPGLFVILFSGSKISAEDQAAGLVAGAADAYMVWPMSRLELLARLEALFRLRTAQESLRQSVREKELLLNEMHHRVKNNLQLMVSLLRLEGASSEEPGTRAALKRMQERIQSMAMLHDTLYRSGNFGRMDLGAYLRQLVKQLFGAYNSKATTVQVAVELATVDVTVDRAIPCGLILNELVTNSLKHAFGGKQQGEVRIGLRQESDGRVRLSVGDTGVGLPPGSVARSKSALGLQLVSDLVRQIDGTLEIGAGPGANFAIFFPPDRAPPVPARVPSGAPFPDSAANSASKQNS